MFWEINDKIFYVNTYYDGINDFITIYTFLEMALSSMIYINMCRLRNIAMRDYQGSVTTGQTARQTDRQMPDKVIPMCRYALQATQ